MAKIWDILKGIVWFFIVLFMAIVESLTISFYQNIRKRYKKKNAGSYPKVKVPPEEQGNLGNANEPFTPY